MMIIWVSGQWLLIKNHVVVNMGMIKLLKERPYMVAREFFKIG